MIPYDKLAEVFDRGLREGIESLNILDRDLFQIQDFIIEYEMGGLSAYFYNRLPDLESIRAAVTALQSNGLQDLASLLDEAAKLFDGYADPEVTTTWSALLQQYDPTHRLNELNDLIGALDNYGLGESNFAS